MNVNIVYDTYSQSVIWNESDIATLLDILHIFITQHKINHLYIYQRGYDFSKNAWTVKPHFALLLNEFFTESYDWITIRKR